MAEKAQAGRNWGRGTMAGTLTRQCSFSALVLAAALTAAPLPAHAEFLLDILLGRVPRQHDRQPPVSTGNVPRVPLPKISSPTFYNYQPQPLTKVDFDALSAELADKANSPFVAALSGLADFQLYAEKPIANALIAYYSSHPTFIWVDGNGPNARAKEVLRVLGDAAQFGLPETDYIVGVPSPTAHSEDSNGRDESLVRFEMTLSARALRYARDAHLGRVDPNALSGYHDFPAKQLDEKAVLDVLAGTPTPALYLESLHPQNELFAALRQELKTLRASAENEIVVDPDTFVRPGGSDPEFPKILKIIDRDTDASFHAEYGHLLVKHMDSETYASELVPIIKAAQKLHDLNPDGIIGRRTVSALAGESKAARIQKVLLSMERLRWHPSHLGSTRVMVNAASFTASFIEDGKEKLSMRAVVGKPTNQTSFFYDEIEFVEFNPYWGVPRSILVNEMLPRLMRDPSYLDRAGYEVTDSRGRRIPSSAIDWAAYGAQIPYSIRQVPSERNALGQLKIMFPNKHAIYMHDTPEKSLFARDTRAFSHGCVRLQHPKEMAAAVLGTTVDDISRTIAMGRNMRRDAPRKIPIYIGYFTAWPEPSGSGISYHPDVYDRDSNLEKALAKVEETRSPGT